MTSLQFAVCSLQRPPTNGWWLTADGCQLPTPSHEPRSTPFGLGGAVALAAALFLASAPALAQVRSSTNYAITVDQLNSGGGGATSASYALRGTTGQAFATPPMVSTNYNNQPGLQAAIPAAGFSLTPASLAFGGQAPGTTSAAQNVTLANTSGVVITLSSIGIGGANAAEFELTNGCGATLAAGAGCTVSVTFTPSGTGAKSAALTVTSSAPGSPHVAALSGTGGTASDTEAPTVPTGLAPTVISSSQINLAWIASSDNVAVAAYQVFRGGVFHATASGSTSFSDTGLAASTPYSYTVAACDGSGNCSAQSASASATTPATGDSFTANLEAGFNLIGNSLNITLNVASLFGNQDAPVAGITSNIVSLWKWNAVAGRWAFYSPQLTAAAITSFAASKNYDVLDAINPGEGYWVNAVTPMSLPAQSGTAFNWDGLNFAALPAGFNLIAHAGNVTPSQFNLDVSPTLPGTGVVPTGNFFTLWAWDAVQDKWYFYSPLLESTGGLPAVKSYADSHFYLHFQDYNKVLGVGVGFWVNATTTGVPPSITVHPAGQTITAGQNASFSVTATGTSLNYQWRRSTDGGANFADIAGATNATLTLTAVPLANNAHQFRVVVSNAAGSVTSSAALLTVNPVPTVPAFTTQPANVTITEGQNAQFVVAVSGTPSPTLQWQLSIDSGATWVNINGATAASYTTPATNQADSGKRYRAVASNASGSVNSNAAMLSVSAPVVGKAWQTAALIETDNAGGAAGGAGAAQVAVNASGQAVAVWEQSNGVSIDIYANRFTAATGWGTPELVETDNTGVAQQAQVVIESSGHAIAVWMQSDGFRNNIWANRYTAGAGWGSAAMIESGLGDAGNPQIAIDGSGNAIAVWWQHEGGRLNVVSNRYVPGTGWGTATVIESDSTGDTGAPQIAIDANGNAVAVWAWASAVPNGFTYDYNVWANRYTAGTGWGVAAPIDSVNTTTANPAPQVALDGSGNAIAVWHRPDGTWDSIWANRYAAGTGWGTPALLETDNTNSARNAQVAFDASGNAIAVWTQSFGSYANVMANRYTVGSGWGTAALIETDDAGSAFEPQIAFDSNGNATAVWYQRNVAGFTFNVWANRFAAATGWGTATMIDNQAGPAGSPQIAVDGNGNVTAVWPQSDGTRANIWANIFK